MQNSIVRQLVPIDAVEYRAIMLHAYGTELEAFTSTVAEREALPPSWWVARVTDQPNLSEIVFGAFVAERLVGVIGLSFERRERIKHRSKLSGLYVFPEFRGQGIARSLVQAALGTAEAAPQTKVIRLTVNQSNDAAIKLYRSFGFEIFGIEPFSVSLGADFLTKLHLWRRVG